MKLPTKERQRRISEGMRLAWARRKADMSSKKIITEYVHPPIPFRGADWSAVFEGYEPGDCIGRGATEAEAVADLRERTFQDDAHEAMVLDNIERSG